VGEALGLDFGTVFNSVDMAAIKTQLLGGSDGDGNIISVGLASAISNSTIMSQQLPIGAGTVGEAINISAVLDARFVNLLDWENINTVEQLAFELIANNLLVLSDLVFDE
ncbi:hypothetical protein RZS08_46645, partial [Arthrospira platensis SPKY1]|nr:hypothetical protein [Arthrospira platensis SPKY1]